MSDQKQKKYGDDEDDSFDAGFKIPDTKSILEKLPDRAEIQADHQKQMEEEDEKEKKGGKKPKKRQKRGGTCCFCGVPNCRIGPFVETEGSSDQE
jgi:hypothetical protein